MHSIHPFGHHSYDEVNYLLEHSGYVLAVRPMTDSHDHVLPYVQHVVLAEIHEGHHTIGYILDPRVPPPVQVDHLQYVESLPHVQLGVAYIPHHGYEHHGYEHHEGRRGGLLHRLTEGVFDREDDD